MRLLDSELHLPPGEGELYAHNSGGEHSTRYSGIEGQYNPLRRSELMPTAKPGAEIADISGDDFQNMLLSDQYEVIIAQQLDAPNQPNRLAGVAIGEREPTSEYATRMTVKELVVHPELRRRHIASYMLGRLTQHFSPTEMVVATDTFTPDYEFIAKLEEAGFRHTSPNGSPSIWLPGNSPTARGDFDNPDHINGLEQHMPAGWDGFWKFYPNGDTQFRVYRNGARIGIVRAKLGSKEFDPSIQGYSKTFVISDAGDTELDVVEGITEKEALVALLNNYELLQTSS